MKKAHSVQAKSDKPFQIVVASENPVKSGAILGAFDKLFPDTQTDVVRTSVASGVSDQPMTDEETKRGAVNRLRAARDQFPDADLWAGVEGGIDRDEMGMFAFAWIVVATKERQTAVRTATFPLPPRVTELIDQGVELGHANDQVFNRDNSKQKEGAIGTLTGGLIDRRALYEHAAIMALSPLKNPDLFGQDVS